MITEPAQANAIVAKGKADWSSWPAKCSAIPTGRSTPPPRSANPPAGPSSISAPRRQHSTARDARHPP